MPRAALVLRPEPGNAHTRAALAAAGIEARALPLFRVEPRAWSVPDPRAYDALLITSANAVRHAGAGLARLASLPVVAVGAATARAARAAGLTVVLVGSRDAADAVAQARAYPRLLHLAGRDRAGKLALPAATVYASVAVTPPPEALAAALDAVVLLHSPRAAERFAALAAALPRERVRLAALSEAVLAAAGDGWRAAAAARAPTDLALVECAAGLAIDP
ncbi:uroporphyrinogen-III synthase [Sphingomonas yunnanensis]|uniref:uroporphyrinogen-III synthase n=1 Tax=Sphingomonas yunnanensis TaxID=310400 RepID=UPI001CA6D859|nr:uroporphyrinogen-III synthase [Sphingomonas yunnanensis]MBY9065038.1 uroporphyrinogen-III synthase [Sphingomonas yunnanensis]